MADDGWTLWGPIWDRRATLDVVKVLQAQGFHVRVVKNGSHNDIYIDKGEV